MASSVTLKALGLNFQPNQLEVPPGSLIEASNCVIRRDDTVEPRRGFKLYGTSFASSTDRLKQLFSYKKTILRHYLNTLEYDSDGQGNFLPFVFNTTYTFIVTSANATVGATYTNSGNTFTVKNTITSSLILITTGLSTTPPALSGILTKTSGTGDATITFSIFSASGDDVIEAQVGLRTKSIESNGNLYFTSSEGIRKISAVTSADFNQNPQYVTRAGGVKALDLTGVISAPVGQQTGFLPADSAVGYRTLWLTKDENGNLIQGTPSQPIEVYNFQLSLLLQDFINLAGQLDNLNTTGSIITFGQFVQNFGVTLSSSPAELQTQLLTLGSQLDFSIEYASDAAATTAVPLQIVSASVDNSINLATVYFAGSPVLSNYFVNGDSIFLTSTSSTANNTPIEGFTLSNTSRWFKFTVTAANATVGAIYQDNTSKELFTVASTIIAGTTLITNGNGKPSVSGTLTKISGTGDATITFSAFTNILTFNSNTDVSPSTSNSITINNHGFFTGQPVRLTPASGTLPTPLNAGTTYYIVNPTTNTFELSLSPIPNGTVVSLTAVGTDTTTNISIIPTVVPTTVDASGFLTINGTQVITNVGSNFIQFSSKSTGAISVSNSKIISHKFETINTTVGTNQTTSLTSLVVTIPYTNAQLVVIQDAISRYMLSLQSLPIGVVSSSLVTQFLSSLEPTTTANVELNITIPQDAQNPNYFFQIYRSHIVTASQAINLATLIPDDEMALVYEAYPTPNEIIAKQVSVLDQTPEAFKGANLYTNAFSGEGIAQANDIPPFALDLNKFNGSVFYANTKTRQRQPLQLLPVNNLISEYNAGRPPVLLVTNGIQTNKYTFQLGVQEVQQITADSYANSTNHGFIILYSSNNSSKYFFRLNKTAPSGNPAGFTVGIDTLVDIDISPYSITGTAVVLAQLLCDKINIEIQDFTAVIDTFTNKVDVTNASEGIVSPGTVNSLGGAWSISVTTAGNGESTATNSILLSTLVSAAQAIDATARSLVRIINRNSNETIYAYYLSGAQDVPGQMLLESRNINVPPFYLLTNNTLVGKSFTPDLSPGLTTITAFTTTNSGDITTSAPHGLSVGQQIVILETGSLSTPNWNGLQTVTHITNNTNFQVGTTTVSGTTGVYILATSAIFSSDEEKKNRIYFSKADQPEAVPIVNYFDIGALDKAILRILPLRDSLFVFKEDGVYRISGIGIPFTTSLFDSSCIVEAPDSVAIANNIIYAWTSQGISTVTEAGVKFNISRPIDTDILKKATNQYTNFKTATWGIGYESDNSYLVSTIINTTDTEATIMYRYSTLTNTWTIYDKSVTCGVVNASGDDKMYLGAGDTDFIEQERKDYLRTDYADREFTVTLGAGGYLGMDIKIPIFNISKGDVITQEQYVTRYLFNELLQKLDLDPGTPTPNFYSTLAMAAGADSHSALVSLATKLDIELKLFTFTVTSANATAGATYTNNGQTFTVTSTITGSTTLITTGTGSPLTSGTLTKTSGTGNATITFSSVATYSTLVSGSTDFTSIKNSYNNIIIQLNSDPTLSFSNYSIITNSTIFEAIVTNVNTATGIITLNLTLDFLQGLMTVYKSINTELTYSPNTFGDPLSLKHFREATIMFENKAFTNATLSFATDLLPAFISIPFNGDGNGIFGHSTFFGSGFFGGASNSAPMRTFIPRDSQRCRYLVVKFNHNIARENFSLFGVTLTGDVTSSRAYR